MFGRHKRQLIKHLKHEGILKNPKIIDAIKKIDRKDFVSKQSRGIAYSDFPIPIGYGQCVPQPHTIIFMIEHLYPESGDKILEVGSGTGWALAILGEIVGKDGLVYGVERIPELVDVGKNNILKYNLDNTKIFQSGNTLGLNEYAPYDKILVSATCKEAPMELVNQLKIGGFMVLPIKNTMCKVIKSSETDIRTERYEGVAFVPLIH